jgi:hypothetical protein
LEAVRENPVKRKLRRVRQSKHLSCFLAIIPQELLKNPWYTCCVSPA